MSRKENLWEFKGRYFLRRHPAGRSPYLHVFWYDRGARQGRYRSLGTADLAEAQQKLVDWVMEQGQLEQGTPRTVTIAQCLGRYKARHKARLKSVEQVEIATEQILHFLGERAVVADLRPERQAEFRAHLATTGKKGYRSPSTVSRVLSVLRAALYDAVKHQELDKAPFIFDVPAKSPARERVLSIDELARLIAAADMPYLETFIWLTLGTAGRKGALLELTKFQCDLERRMLRLNPPGRVQTKKRRPELPICDFLAGMIAALPGPHLIARESLKATAGEKVQQPSKPLAGIKRAWQRTVAAAGLEGVVTPNTIRHTVGTWLRSKGVPEQECAGFMGHRWSNSTTEVYGGKVA